jgi:hypothetical protein
MTLTVDRPQAPQMQSARDWPAQSRTLARGASRAAQMLPGVLSAEFSISGPPAEPVLHLDCRLLRHGDPASVMEHITTSLVEDLEDLLGVRFAERHVEVSIDETGTAPHRAGDLRTKTRGAAPQAPHLSPTAPGGRPGTYAQAAPEFSTAC